MTTKDELLRVYLDGLNSKEIKRLEVLLSKPGVGYKELYDFTKATTKKLGAAFALIDEDLTIDLAEELIRPLLDMHTNMIAETAYKTQKRINKANEVGLAARKVIPSKDRADGIIKKACSGPIDETGYILQSGVMTYAKSIVDENCKINAEAQYKAGLTPVITRKTGPGGCCKWCQQWAGIWEYPEVPNEVYMRHRSCDCVVEYKNGRMKQNVHTKQWSNLQPSEIVKQPGGALSMKQAEDYEKYLKQKKRNDAINALAEERGITYEKAKREMHLMNERIRDRARYRAGQRRNARYR